MRPLKAATCSRRSRTRSAYRCGSSPGCPCRPPRQAIVDSSGRGAPVFVQFRRTGTGVDLSIQRRGCEAIALAAKPEVHRESLRRLRACADMPCAGRAGGGVGAGRWAGAAAEHGGHAGIKRLVDLLRADEVDVAVKTAGGEDLAFASDRLGPGPMMMSTPAG